MKPKKLAQLTFAALSLFSAPLAQAFNYADQDVILIFRKDGYNNVEFDLGGVGQFLNQPDGKVIHVTNWDLGLVRSNFAIDDGTAQVILVASTSATDTNRRAWLTDSQPTAVVTARTPSQWQQLWSKISGIGKGAQTYTATSATNYAVVPAGNFTSFDYIASNAGSQYSVLPLLGGYSAFNVVGTIPTVLRFYEIPTSTAATKPPANLVGSFTLGVDGSLTFKAGPVTDAAQILSVTKGAGGASVSFNTAVGVKYRLRYSPTLSAGRSSWSILPGTAIGDGNPQTLQDTAPAGSARYYAVESFQ